jgi:teichuronic acid biosynthesis glycosyltransferase TuaG
MKKPLVSIVTPVFKAERWIADCIASVRSQTLPDWEMVLVDDRSPDGSIAQAREAAGGEARIRILSNERNLGPGSTRNRGIEAAKGRFIAFVDADDAWYPSKLERQIQFMRDRGSPLSYTSYEVMDDRGDLTGRVVHARPSVTWRTMLYSNYIGCSTAIYDREQVGTRLMPGIRKRQDYALWLSILEDVKEAHGLDEVLVRYRIGAQSVSSNKLSAARYNWTIYRRFAHQGVLASAWYFTNYMVRGIAHALL